LPARDLRDLAQRFLGLPADAPEIARGTPYGYAVGDKEDFYVFDLITPRITTISATLRLITDHAYFFIEDGVAYSDSALQTIGSDFETVVYPSIRQDFGSEPLPGVDSDPRITLLHASLRGAGGFYNLSDQYPRVVVPTSNEREMLYLEASVLGSPGPAYNGLVAHELQHLIHWNADPTEDSWVNEGLSQVAAQQVGAGSDWLDVFLQQPDTQLTFWPEIDDAAVHYAAAELFMSYLLDHYGGRQRARDLLAERGDSITGVDEYLAQFGKNFRDVFADWVAANWLDTQEGPYSHPRVSARTRIRTRIEAGTGSAHVAQFGADYLSASSPGVFSFEGATDVSNGISGADGPYWWSNRGDGADTRLTREVNLHGLSRATLRFRTWYDLERGWDYGYVAASEDGGKTWRALSGDQTTDYNPVGLAYGPGYTGTSSGWIQESIDLSAYAGKTILLRFEQVTDDATSLTGFAIDDIEIPELALADHVDGASGWQAEGFLRVTGPLRQEFIVQVIEEGSPPNVTRVALDADNRAEIALVGPAIITVSGATAGTAEPAEYAWTFR